MEPKLETLVAKLRDKGYSPEVRELPFTERKAVSFALEPSKHPEWKSYYIKLRGYLIGDGDYGFGEESVCELTFEKDGRIEEITYHLSPHRSVSSYLPRARGKLEILGKLIEFDLLSE